jgi:hypothetical protein
MKRVANLFVTRREWNSLKAVLFVLMKGAHKVPCLLEGLDRETKRKENSNTLTTTASIIPGLAPDLSSLLKSKTLSPTERDK